MTCSLAQVESNRRNALSSTGPRSESGRKKSARNSLKSGLTGAGIVLPDEDAEALDLRFAVVEAEMKPKNEMARQILKRAVLMTIRHDRSAANEAKAIAIRMREATARYNDARLAEVENYYSWIASEPVTNARRLRSSPEGIDRLIKSMEELKSDLAHPEGVRWGWQHCEQLHHMLGRRRMDVPVTRARALTEAIAGNFKYLSQNDGPDLAMNPRQLMAVGAEYDLLEEEIAKLKALRETLDLEGIELDRLEAPARAMFDGSKEAILARKYEASNDRTLFRSLREFRDLQAEAPEVEEPPQDVADLVEELGSFFPEPSGEEVAEEVVDPTEPEADPEVVQPAAETLIGGSEANPEGSKPLDSTA